MRHAPLNRCYKSLVFMVATSLSFCLFAQILHQNLHADEGDECEGVLSIALPSTLEGFGRSDIRVTDKNKKQLFTGGKTIIINEITNESIGHPEFTGPEYDHYTISFLVDGQVKAIGLSIQKTDKYHPFMRGNSSARELVSVLREVPRNLLGRVNKIAVLFTTKEKSEVELERYNALFHAMFFSFRPRKERKASRMDIVEINETYHSPAADEIIIRLPIMYEEERDIFGLDTFYLFIFDSIVEHQLGHIMAYHRYGEFTPDQEWHNAILADNASVSEYGDTNMAEDFAEAMALYLRTDRRLLHPDTEGRYTHRMEILDEIMGLNSSQRRQIEERNREIDHLFKQLGLLNGLDNMFVDRHTAPYFSENVNIIAERIRSLREDLMVDPDALIIARTLASKALTLHRNRPLDFTSTDESSVRENLIRTLAFNGLYFLPTEKDEKNTSFITNTIHLLDTLSTSEMKRRLHVLDQVFVSSASLLEDSYINVEQALRFFNRHSLPQELYGEKFSKSFNEMYRNYMYNDYEAADYTRQTDYFVLTTISLQGTLSSSDMEKYLHTLKEAANIFIEKYEEYKERLRRRFDLDEDEDRIEEIEKDIREHLPFFKIVGRILDESPTGRRIKEALRRVLRERGIEEEIS